MLGMMKTGFSSKRERKKNLKRIENCWIYANKNVTSRDSFEMRIIHCYLPF